MFVDIVDMSLQVLPVELIERIEQHLSYPDRVSLHTALSYDVRSPYQLPFFLFWKKLLGRIDACFEREKRNYQLARESQRHSKDGKSSMEHRKYGRWPNQYDYRCTVQCCGWSLPLVYGVPETDVKIFPWLGSVEERLRCTTRRTATDQCDQSMDIDDEAKRPVNSRHDSTSETGFLQKICTIWITVYCKTISNIHSSPEGLTDEPDNALLPAMLRTVNEMDGTIVTVGQQRIAMQIRCKTIEKFSLQLYYDHMDYTDVPFSVQFYYLNDRLRYSYSREHVDSRWYTRWYCFHQNAPFPSDLLTAGTRFYEDKIERIIRNRHPFVGDILERELAKIWRSYSIPVSLTQEPDVYHLITTWPLPCEDVADGLSSPSSYFRLEFVNITRDEFAAQSTSQVHANTVVRLQWYLVNEFSFCAKVYYFMNAMRPQFPFTLKKESPMYELYERNRRI